MEFKDGKQIGILKGQKRINRNIMEFKEPEPEEDDEDEDELIET